MGDDTIFTEHAADIIDALDTLYIPLNKGGRVAFIKKYPDIAQYVFGDALYAVDTTGTGDRAVLHDLEAAAETRRLQIVDIVRALQENPDETLLIFYPAQFLYQSPLLPHLFTPVMIDRINAFFESGEKPSEDRDYAAEAAFETDRPTLLQTEENEELQQAEKDNQSSSASLSVPAIDMKKMMKDGTDIGKDILSDLQHATEDYTPVVRKTLDGLRDTVRRTAIEKAKQAEQTYKAYKKKQSKPVLKDVQPIQADQTVRVEKPPAPFAPQPTDTAPASPSETEAETEAYTIQGAIDIEYDRQDYTYLYARDGYSADMSAQTKPNLTGGTINTRIIADHVWGQSQYVTPETPQSGTQNIATSLHPHRGTAAHV